MNNDAQLTPKHLAAINASSSAGIEVSIISCWEVAKLVENKKLGFKIPVIDWLNLALSFPGVRLLPLTPEIVADSTQPPGVFHKDPADQMIVSTARVSGLSLLTMDQKILSYPHVSLATV